MTYDILDMGTSHTIGNHSVCPADPLAVEGEHHSSVLVLVFGRRRRRHDGQSLWCLLCPVWSFNFFVVAKLKLNSLERSNEDSAW